MDWLWDTLGALAVVIIAVFWLFEKTGFSKEDYRVSLSFLAIIAIFILVCMAVWIPYSWLFG